MGALFLVRHRTPMYSISMSRIRRFSLGLMAAVVVASTFSTIVPQANVSALSFSGATSPSDLARAYLYGTWVKACISKNLGHNFDGVGINEGGWTSDSSDSTGMIGVQSYACKDVSAMTEGMKGVGVPWGNGKERIEALCKMGVTRVQPGGRTTQLPCYGPDAETGKDSIEVVADWNIGPSVPDGFVRYVNTTAGGDIFSPSALIKYFFYYDIVFKRQCDISPDTGSVGATNVTTIPEIQADGTFKDATYKYDGNAKIKIPYGAINTLGLGDGSGTEIQCYKMGDKLRALSKDPAVAREWLAKYSPGHDGVPGTCDEYAKYHTVDGVDTTAICVEGYRNKSDPTYCSVHYPPGQTDSQITAMKPKSDACEYGAKVATAESGVTVIDTSGAKTPDSKSTCGITGVGWIVCPVMTFLADVMDNTFKFLADSFLSTDPEVFKIGSPTQKAWSIFLSYANVAFVIVFMIIIYSQITSAGIGNYGIKKMLPRLIVGAILVNISYYICQAAIDLSNVLGYSILNLFTTITGQVGPGVSLDWNGTIAAVLAIGAAAGLLIALGGSFLIAALLAVAMVVLILLARKAIIILLVVLSPLAFVAYLLPNTESLFNRWRKMLTTVLLVFPIISLVFGASKLASAIIYNTDKENMVVKLMALGIAAIPLFVILPLLKGAMAAVPVIGGKLQGMSNKATGRASSAGKKGMNDRYTNSTLGRLNKYRAGEASKRSALIQAGAYKGRAANPLNWSRNIRSGANSRFNKSGLSGGFGDKTAAAGSALADKQTEEEINAAKSTLGGKTFDDINQMAHDTKLDEATRTAAIRHIMEKGNFSQRNALVKASKSMSSLQRNAVVSGVMSRGDSAVYGAKIGDAITRGEVGSDADVAGHVAQNIADGKIKAETMVHDADATRLIADVTTGGGSYTIKDSSGTATLRTLSTVETTAVRDAAATAASLPATASKVSQNFKDQFGRL